MTAEEKLRHERRERRRLRQKESQNQYHHIPCSAALDFARTATPEPLILEKVHKLARPIMEHYTGESPCDVHQCQSLTLKSPGPEVCSSGVMEASRSSGDRVLRRKIAQRNLEISRYAQLSSPTHNSPFSAGRNPSPEYLHQISSHRRSITSPPPVNDRPDWTEQDECLDPHSPSIFSKVGPLLRKSESIWSVRHDVGKHTEGVIPRDGDSIVNMRQGSRFGYPWNCVCFV